MKQDKTKTYLAPSIKVVRFVVEVGAAMSVQSSSLGTETSWVLQNSESDNGNSNTRLFERSWGN